jgi:transcriptional regulator with XRE-family HTH domain
MDNPHPLKLWRQNLGLSQGAAAELLALTEPTLSRYETGSRSPSLAQAAKLSEKTGIPLDKFVKTVEAAE